MTDGMSIGERVAFYRKRRGISQEVLAGLIGRTADWLRKVEHDRMPLDRLSVIRSLTEVLDISLADLIGEPQLLEWSDSSGHKTVPALRAALMDHRQFLWLTDLEEPRPLSDLQTEISLGWDDFQSSRYGRLLNRLPTTITETLIAARHHAEGTEAGMHAQRLVALTHQLATVLATKLGEADLASIAAIHGLTAAQKSGSELFVGSLIRSVVHALLSIGQFCQAVDLTRRGADLLQAGLGKASPEFLSVYGMLHLVGSVAASRDEDRSATIEFLSEAQQAANRLGTDANYLWTAFGPTNVEIHRVVTAMELGDVQLAVDLGPRVNTSGLPLERRVRHTFETARAFHRRNRVEEALGMLLSTERLAPEQVRYHRIPREIVRNLVRRPRPPALALSLGQRMGIQSER